MDEKENRMCENSVCPTSNVSPANTVNCHYCKKYFHLACYDIISTKAKVFVSKHIVFLCDDCLECQSPKRKTERKTSNEQLTATVSSYSSSERAQSHPLTTIVTNKRVAELIGELSMKIDNNTSTLSQLKNGVDLMHSTIRDNNNTTYANVLGAVQQRRTQLAPDAQQINSSAPKATAAREEMRSLDAETKIALKKRQLTAGNSTKQGLGAAVTIDHAKLRKFNEHHWKNQFMFRV